MLVRAEQNTMEPAIDEGYRGGAKGKWRRPAHTSIEYATLVKPSDEQKPLFISVPRPPPRIITII
jgi:hypothetical protein